MAARRSDWGNDDASWDERNWDAVQRQEQKKQDVLVMASQNSESIRRMVRQVDETRNVAGETLTTLDQQSGRCAIPTFALAERCFFCRSLYRRSSVEV